MNVNSSVALKRKCGYLIPHVLEMAYISLSLLSLSYTHVCTHTENWIQANTVMLCLTQSLTFLLDLWQIHHRFFLNRGYSLLKANSTTNFSKFVFNYCMYDTQI